MLQIDLWSPTGKAHGTSVKYPPAPSAVKFSSTRAQGFGGVSASSAIRHSINQRHTNDLTAQSAFIQGRALGLLRRRIKYPFKSLLPSINPPPKTTKVYLYRIRKSTIIFRYANRGKQRGIPPLTLTLSLSRKGRGRRKEVHKRRGKAVVVDSPVLI